MAITTRPRRASTIQHSQWWLPVLPAGNGAITDSEQQWSLHLYSGIALATLTGGGSVIGYAQWVERPERRVRRYR